MFKHTRQAQERQAYLLQQHEDFKRRQVEQRYKEDQAAGRPATHPTNPNMDT